MTTTTGSTSSNFTLDNQDPVRVQATLASTGALDLPES